MDTIAGTASLDTAHGPRTTLWLLRGIVTLHAIDAALQPVLAGWYLSGGYGALAVHGLNGSILAALCLVMVIVAVVYWLGGRGLVWPVIASAALLVAEVFQLAFGYDRQLALHIPLGVAIVTGAVLLAVAVWLPGARRYRPRRQPAAE